MINPKTKERELAYVVHIDAIEPIIGSDNCEAAIVGGWRVMTRKGTFKVGDKAVYFEIDSKLPEKPEFEFLAAKHYKVKTQKYTFGGKGLMISQGLLMSFADFGWDNNKYEIETFLTKELGVKYSVAEDNKRKATVNKYARMKQRNTKLFNKYKWLNKIYAKKWGKKLLFLFLGNRRDARSALSFPDGKFPGVSRTDQERCENMTWILEDKTPFIVTQKCDGSSGTFILARKHFGRYEFYVCSRNVRMLKPEQSCYYGDDNYYWDAAIKYNIKEKMKDYLDKNKDISFVCWQGEICAPKIQSNPHNLKELHLYCFHMTDSKNGRYDIRDAKKIWDEYEMETVPIIDTNFILPDNFEEFKKQADGKYDPIVCEGDSNCDREGFVYYKSTDPNFSFKNVSREYLIKRGQ